MIDFFKDIFIYHYDSNQQLIDVFIQHQTTLSERTLPLFTHALEAQLYGIIAYRVIFLVLWA